MPEHHIHHQHDLDHVHYEPRCHDNYPSHHHEWAGNNHFDTVNDDCHADDHELVTPGDDHNHPGFDIRWADQHSRTTPPAGSVAGNRH